MQRAVVSLLVAACLLCTATALVETIDSTPGAVFVSQHVSPASFIEAPGHNMRNGLFHPGGRRVDHTAANSDDDDEEEQDDSQEKVSHDPSENGDEGDDDESAEESGEQEEEVQEDPGSDSEDLKAERRAERLADRYGGIPEDYLGKDVDQIIQTRREARQQSLIDAPKGRLSLFPPRNMDEESDEEAPAQVQAPPRPLASNAPRGGRGGFGPRMQEVNSPFGFPETPAMAGNFVPGAGAMSVADNGIDPSYDVTSPADQAMYAFEQQQKLMGLPQLPMEGGGIMEQNFPLPRFPGVQEPRMPNFNGAPQMEQEPMMGRPKPQVKFVDPRFRSVEPTPQRVPMARGGFAQRGPAEAEQEEMEQEEAPQRPAANPAAEFRFRAASKASKASASKWDHSQTHITQRFLTNIGYARQQRALQRRRENGRDRQQPRDAEAPEARDKQEEEHETQQQNLGIPPPPDFHGPAFMEEEARVHAHTAQGHTHGVARAQRASSAADVESEAVPPRRTRYERMFARSAPRARRGSLLEVDAASEMDSREVQGKPAGLPDMPEFEAPPPDPAAAAQQSTRTGPAGLREEVYSPPHVVI